MFKSSIFFIGFLIIACKNEKKIVIDEIKHKTDVCFTKKEKEEIIHTILQNADFQMFLHPHVEGRLPIKLVKNEFVTPNLEIESNGYQVVFKDSLILPDGAIHRIRIVEKDCKKKRVSYSIFYPIEGAVLTGNVFKSDSLWLTSDTNWGVKD